MSIAHQLETFAKHNAYILVETHISWVLLSTKPEDPVAYKIKKPVNFGFLDYSSLQKRKHFCEEELRLNSRFAPQLYQSVVGLFEQDGELIIDEMDHLIGKADRVINKKARAIEYAVKMRLFDRRNELDTMLKEKRVTIDDCNQLATSIALAHDNAAILQDMNSPLATAECIWDAVNHNIEVVREHINIENIRLIDEIEHWNQDRHADLIPIFNARRREGFIKECHGDLHSGNIVNHEGEFVLFDCIEFNEEFRWIDVMSEIAFLLMDLDDKGYANLSNHLLNRYLEFTGDYAGLALLNFYKSYRAMVRAKVTMLRLDQVAESEKKSLHDTSLHYIQLALRYSQAKRPQMILMHGLSGSGKSYIAQRLLSLEALIHLRSDVERKRLFNLKPQEESGSTYNKGIYTKEASIKTFERLKALADHLLSLGFSTIIDATFLQAKFRSPFIAIAQKHGVPFKIIGCEASKQTLKQRIIDRSQQKKDASEANVGVLMEQLHEIEAFTHQEKEHLFNLNTEQEIRPEQLQEILCHIS